MIDNNLFQIRERTKKQNRSFGQLVDVSMVGQIGYVIAFPLVVGALIGKYTHHILLGIGLGFIVSFTGFICYIYRLLQKK